MKRTGNSSSNAGENNHGRQECAIPTRCHTPRRRSLDDLMKEDWAEFVIRYDGATGKYITRTACCIGAPAC